MFVWVERPMSRWKHDEVEMKTDSGVMPVPVLICEHCKRTTFGVSEVNFCQHCGADMRTEEQRRDDDR